jgi:hypothetical protein
MGLRISKKIEDDRKYIISNSFNNAIYSAVINSLQTCTGIGDVTKEILLTGKGDISTIVMRQELAFIKNCLASDNFKINLITNLEYTVQDQINKVTQNKDADLLRVAINYDVQSSLEKEKSYIPLSLALFDINNLLLSSKSESLDKQQLEKITNIMRSGIRNFTQQINIIARIRNELEDKTYIPINIERFVVGTNNSCFYVFILILAIIIVVSKINLHTVPEVEIE